MKMNWFGGTIHCWSRSPHKLLSFHPKKEAEGKGGDRKSGGETLFLWLQVLFNAVIKSKDRQASKIATSCPTPTAAEITVVICCSVHRLLQMLLVLLLQSVSADLLLKLNCLHAAKYQSHDQKLLTEQQSGKQQKVEKA